MVVSRCPNTPLPPFLIESSCSCSCGRAGVNPTPQLRGLAHPSFPLPLLLRYAKRQQSNRHHVLVINIFPHLVNLNATLTSPLFATVNVCSVAYRQALPETRVTSEITRRVGSSGSFALVMLYEVFLNFSSFWFCLARGLTRNKSMYMKKRSEKKGKEMPFPLCVICFCVTAVVDLFVPGELMP